MIVIIRPTPRAHATAIGATSIRTDVHIAHVLRRTSENRKLFLHSPYVDSGVDLFPIITVSAYDQSQTQIDGYFFNSIL